MNNLYRITTMILSCYMLSGESFAMENDSLHTTQKADGRRKATVRRDAALESFYDAATLPLHTITGNSGDDTGTDQGPVYAFGTSDFVYDNLGNSTTEAPTDGGAIYTLGNMGETDLDQASGTPFYNAASENQTAYYSTATALPGATGNGFGEDYETLPASRKSNGKPDTTYLTPVSQNVSYVANGTNQDYEGFGFEGNYETLPNSRETNGNPDSTYLVPVSQVQTSQHSPSKKKTSQPSDQSDRNGPRVWSPETYATGMHSNPLFEGIYIDPDLLEPHRINLISLESSRHRRILRWAYPDGIPNRMCFFFSAPPPPYLVSGRSFPLDQEPSLKRILGFTGFIRGTSNALMTEVYVSFPALIAYHLASGKSSNTLLKVFLGGNICDLYGISSFTGHQAVSAFFILPLLNGLKDAYFGAKLGNKGLSNHQRQEDLAFLRNTASTGFQDFWREALPFPPLHNSLTRLTQASLWDNRLTSVETAQILEGIQVFSQDHGMLNWINAMDSFYKIADGPSSHDFHHLSKDSQARILTQKAQALKNLHEALKNSQNNAFRRLYIHSLLGKLGLCETTSENVFWTSFHMGKAGLKLFLIQGILNVAYNLATWSLIDTPLPSQAPTLENLENSASNSSTPTIFSSSSSSAAALTSPTPLATSSVLNLTSPTSPAVNSSSPTLETSSSTATLTPPSPTSPAVTSPAINSSLPTLETAALTSPPPTSPAVTSPAVNSSLPTLETSSSTAAPTSPPPTSPAVTSPAVNLTSSTPLATSPTVNPTTTLSAAQIAAAQLQCFNGIVQNWNLFPQENPAVNVLPQLSRLSNLPANININLSGKGLSAASIASFFTGFATSHPNITIGSVDLSGNFMPNNAALQTVLSALPSSITALKWELDYTSQPSQSDSLNFTRLANFKNLTSFDFGGWYIGNDVGALSSFSQVLPSLTQLTFVNMSATYLGQLSTNQTSIFITELFKWCPHLQTADFSYNVIGANTPNDVIALSTALNTTIAPLQTINLQNNFIGYKDSLQTFSLLQSFNKTATLTRLNLGNNYIGKQPATGATYAQTLTASLRGGLSNLQNLNITGNFFSNSSLADLGALRDALTQLPFLKNLYVARPALTAPPFPSTFMTPLRGLNLTETDLAIFQSQGDVTAFFGNLSANTTIIDLSGQILLNTTIIQAVADGLSNYPYKQNIVKIDVSGNNNNNGYNPLLSPFTQLLAPAVGTFSNLKELDLGGNHIYNLPDQISWANTVGNCTKLQVLNLQGNYFGTWGDIPAWGVSLNKMPSLTTFILENEIYIPYSPDFLGTLVSGLSGLKNFTTLKLSHANIYGPPDLDSGVGINLTSFFKALQSMPGLTQLDISDNRLGTTNITDGTSLATALPNSLQSFDISYNLINTQGTQGADALVAAVLNLMSTGNLTSVNLAGLNVSASFRAQNQANFTQIINPRLLAACGQDLFNLVTNATNSSSSGEHRRSLPEEIGEISHDSGSLPQDPSLENDDYFEGGEDAFERPASNFQESERDAGLGDFVTSDASRPMPPRPLVFVGEVLKNVADFFRGTPPTLATLAPSWKSLESEPLAQSLPSPQKFGPLEFEVPHNGTSTDTCPIDAAPSAQKAQKPILIAPPSLDSMLTSALIVTHTAKKAWNWWMSPPEVETKQTTFKEGTKTGTKEDLSQAFEKIEQKFLSVKETFSDKLLQKGYQDQLDALREELSVLSSDETVNKSRLNRFKKDLTWFHTCLRQEEQETRVFKKAEKFSGEVARKVNRFSQTLEALQSKMPQWLLTSLQGNRDQLQKVLPFLKDMPETQETKELYTNVKQILKQSETALRFAPTVQAFSEKLDHLSESLTSHQSTLPVWLFEHHQTQTQQLQNALVTLPRILKNHDLIKFRDQLKGALEQEEKDLLFAEKVGGFSQRVDGLSDRLAKHQRSLPKWLLTPLQKEIQTLQQILPHFARLPEGQEREKLHVTLTQIIDQKEETSLFSSKMIALSQRTDKLSASLKARQGTMPSWLFTRFQENINILQAAFSRFESVSEDQRETLEKDLKKALQNQEEALRFSEKIQHVSQRVDGLSASLKARQSTLSEGLFSIFQHDIQNIQKTLPLFAIMPEGPQRKALQTLLNQTIEQEEAALRVSLPVQRFSEGVDRLSQNLQARQGRMPSWLFDHHQKEILDLQKAVATFAKTLEKQKRKELEETLKKALAQKASDLLFAEKIGGFSHQIDRLSKILLSSKKPMPKGDISLFLPQQIEFLQNALLRLASLPEGYERKAFQETLNTVIQPLYDVVIGLDYPREGIF